MALRAPLDEPLACRDLRRARNDARVPQLVDRRDLRAGRAVGLAVGVDQDLHPVEPVLLDEVLSVPGSPLTDDRQARSRLLELLPVAVQLHRVRSAEDSAVV